MKKRTILELEFKHALDTPSEDLISINPEGWVVERNYASKNYEETLKLFLLERNASIIWLKSLNTKNWEQVVKHPELGGIVC